MATTINNSANISYEYGSNTDRALSNVVSTILADIYELNATKNTLNTTFRPGENITYNISVSNNGSEPLFAVSIQDDLGGSTNPLSFITGSARIMRNDTMIGIVPTNTSPLTFVVPDALEAGETIVLTYVAKVRNDLDTSINNIVNSATIVGHEVNDTGTPITVTPLPTSTIVLENYANVNIIKSVDKDNAIVGDALEYTFRLENSGNSEANNVLLIDNLPEKFSVTSITSLMGDVETIFEATDYTIDATNKLTLPTSTTKSISVPARTEFGNGLTIVTITGTITE